MKLSNHFCVLCTILASSVSLVSCTLSDELNKINSIQSIQATGSFDANILDQTWLLKDIIPADKLNLKAGTDGTYSLGYDNTSTYTPNKVIFPVINVDGGGAMPLGPLNLLPAYNSTPIGSYFSMPTKSIDFEIPKPSLGTTSFSDDFKINTIVLKKDATITLAMEIESNSTTLLTVSIPSITKNGAAYSKTFDPIVGDFHGNLTIDDLDGYTLDASSQLSLSIQPAIKRISTPVTGSINGKYSINIASNYQSVDGFFGEMTFTASPFEFPVSLPDSFSGASAGEMIVKEITITLVVTENNLIAPVNLDLSKGSLCYYKGNNTPQPVVLTNVSTSADGKTFVFKLTDLNVLNIEKLVLNPVITLNKGLKTGVNKLTDTSSLTYDINTVLPLNIAAKDLAFEQEGDNPFKDTNLDSENFELKDGNVVLIGTVNSEIPLGSSIQVYYRDQSKDGTYLSPLLDEPLVIKSGTSSFSTTITKAKLDAIKGYKYQVVKITLNGSGSILSTQTINMKIGAAAKGTVIIKTKN